MKKLNDYFWVWGHPTNSLFNNYGLNKESDVSPVMGVKYLGAKNLFWVPMYKPHDKEQECELAKDIPNLIWSIEDVSKFPEKLTKIIDLSKTYNNIKGIVFDDFFNCENKYNNYLNYTPEMLKDYRTELHKAGLEMWIVVYTKIFTKELDMDTIKNYIKEFDGVSLWFWNEQEVIDSYDQCISVFFDIADGKKKMVGCYLYDFGGEKSANAEIVLNQLNSAKHLIESDKIDGVVLHTNAIINEDKIEAVEACRDWLSQYGNEIIKHR